MFSIGHSTLLVLTTMTGISSGAARSEVSLSVTATVVRPVEIAMPRLSAEGAVIILNNSSAIDVRVTGARLSRPDDETIVIKSDGSPSIGLTIIY